MKTLVQKQADFLLAVMQEKIMDLPLSFARRIVGLTDVVVAHKILKELSVSLLNELRDLPQKAVQPNWLGKVEEDDGK